MTDVLQRALERIAGLPEVRLDEAPQIARSALAAHHSEPRAEGLRSDPVPPYTDDRGDLQEAWVHGYHAAERALAATPPAEGLDVERLRWAIEKHAANHKNHSRTHVRGECAKAIAEAYRAPEQPE